MDEGSQRIKVTEKGQTTTGGKLAGIAMDLADKWYYAFQGVTIGLRQSKRKIPMENLGDDENSDIRDEMVAKYAAIPKSGKNTMMAELEIPKEQWGPMIDAGFTFPQIIHLVLLNYATTPLLSVRIYYQRGDGVIECPDLPFTRVNQKGYTIRNTKPPVSLLFTMDYETMTPNYKVLKFFDEDGSTQATQSLEFE